MTYNEIQDKYNKANITNYKFKNALQVKGILGYDFRTIRGFKALCEGDKALAEFLICNYLNSWGLETREKIRLLSIIRYRNRFKVTFKDRGFSYLCDDGTVG